MKYKIGDKVRVADNCDNENYNQFKNKNLIITQADNKGRGYDKELYPETLYSFKDEENNEIPYSLYDYELRRVK